MTPALPVVLFLAVVLAGAPSCSATEPPPAAWISALIAEFGAAPVANPPHRILRYRYREQSVYYVPPSCCDRPSVLYDDQGRVLCAPDGGMTGRGDGRCTDFAASRRDEVLIWRDIRSHD